MSESITGNEGLINEIEVIEKRLFDLDKERETLVVRREILNSRIAIPQNDELREQLNLSVKQKIELFSDLFKGRVDVYATRWENSKGRNGYSVACDNEWVQGICNKPKVKCSECSKRKFKILDNNATYEHLSGKKTIGLYPLLLDNKCHLLAVDFDKTGWQEAVKAMAHACTEFEIPCAIEISRSGNGAHLWIFFSEAIFARDTRLLGFALLDKSMEIFPSLSFESYDRLFPSQDLLPEGGFGNLIALPLQYQPRQQGNSQFVDCHLIPYSDQWEFLSQMKKVSPQHLLKIVPYSAQSDDGVRPWEYGQATKYAKIENCPTKMTITLANHLYIRLDKLPSLLLARLRRLVSFSNPVFFKTQALRFSTHGIPRYISCARIEKDYLVLPRGCCDDAIELLTEQNISIKFDDKRILGDKLESLNFLGNLSIVQKRAVNAMVEHDTGVLHAPTAFGKTVVAIGIIVKRKVNTLILVHSRYLLEQWQERLNSFLNNVEIGILGGGKKRLTGQVDIATYQSLINKKDNSVNPIVQEYGQVIVDECHHVSAPRYEMVLNEVRAKFVLGLTATPERQDGHQKIIFMIAGPIRYKVKSSKADNFEQFVVVTQLPSQPPTNLFGTDGKPKISDVYRWLAEDSNRNQRIVDDVTVKIEEGKHPLVLTERREHADKINQLLEGKGFQTVVLRGGMRSVERKEANEQLANAQVIVATGKYVGEGFDLPRLDTLFLALPIAWKGSLTQYAGRIHRESEGKDRVTIFDYVDSLPMLQRMYKKREKGYNAMGYQIVSADRKDDLITKEMKIIS